MRYLLALGALLLITAAGTSADLFEAFLRDAAGGQYATNIKFYCETMSSHLKQALDKTISVKHLPNFARDVLKEWDPWLNFGGPGRKSKILIDALEAVANGKDCDQSSLKFVATLSSCISAMDYKFQDLILASTEYKDRCLTNNYLDKSIDWVSSSKRMGLGPIEFMDETFLSLYRNENPGEPALHFGTNAGENCCRPGKAQDAIIKSIESHEGKIRDRGSLNSYLHRYLIRPCMKYRNEAQVVMYEISRACALPDGPQEKCSLIESLSQRSKDNIFRFNMCENVISKRDGDILKLLAEKLNLK